MSASTIAPTKGLVLISGITGFIASVTARTFLDAGYTVRGTARTAAKASAFTSAPAFAAATAEGRLEVVVVPDIVADGAFDEAVKGVQWFLHAASPLPSSASGKDNEHELLIPALRGTVVALRSATKEPQVKKVVILSSMASVVDYSKPSQAGIVYDESNWNPLSYEFGKTANVFAGYTVSKTIAEKTAWDFVESEKPSFHVVSINPSFVYGESYAPLDPTDPFPGTNRLISSLLLDPAYDASTAMGGPNFVDVRDVAQAHLLAVEKDAANGRRFIVSGPTVIPSEYIGILARAIPSYAPRLPRSLGVAKEKELKDDAFILDRRASEEVLGVRYHSPEETLRDTALWILRVAGQEKAKV